MNPLTQVKNITRLSQREIHLDVDDKKSWHRQYRDSAWIFIGGIPFAMSEGDIICVFSQYGEVANINLRIIRVDHVKGYKPPGYKDNQDPVTRDLHEHGVAPRTPPSPARHESALPADRSRASTSTESMRRSSGSRHVDTKTISTTAERFAPHSGSRHKKEKKRQKRDRSSDSSSTEQKKAHKKKSKKRKRRHNSSSGSDQNQAEEDDDRESRNDDCDHRRSHSVDSQPSVRWHKQQRRESRRAKKHRSKARTARSSKRHTDTRSGRTRRRDTSSTSSSAASSRSTSSSADSSSSSSARSTQSSATTSSSSSAATSSSSSGRSSHESDRSRVSAERHGKAPPPLGLLPTPPRDFRAPRSRYEQAGAGPRSQPQPYASRHMQRSRGHTRPYGHRSRNSSHLGGRNLRHRPPTHQGVRGAPGIAAAPYGRPVPIFMPNQGPHVAHPGGQGSESLDQLREEVETLRELVSSAAMETTSMIMQSNGRDKEARVGKAGAHKTRGEEDRSRKEMRRRQGRGEKYGGESYHVRRAGRDEYAGGRASSSRNAGPSHKHKYHKSSHQKK